MLSHSKADSYILNLERNEVIEIHNIVSTVDNNIYIIGTEFVNYSNLYTYPYPCSKLNIFVVNNFSEFKLMVG